jgi:hypothetical protein
MYTEWTEGKSNELKVNSLQMMHFTVLTQKQLDFHLTFWNKDTSLVSLKC